MTKRPWQELADSEGVTVVVRHYLSLPWRVLANFSGIAAMLESRQELGLHLLSAAAVGFSTLGLAMVAGGALTKIFVRLDGNLLSVTRGRHGKSLARVALIEINFFAMRMTRGDTWRIVVELQDGSSTPLPLRMQKWEQAYALVNRLDEIVAQLRTPAGYRQ